jgi:ribosome-associated heat shock protein Hsp15
VGGQAVKASRNVKPGDLIDIKQPPITRSYRIKQTASNRMGAKLVPDFLEETTTPQQLELLEMARLAQSMNRARGMGRPTKKERRDLDDLLDTDWDDDLEEADN